MSTLSYDYVVIGLGGIGSGALYWLSRSTKKRVLGIEQFELGHHNGGSQDHSRIIRLAYESPEYTILAPHTYTAWSAVENESGLQLVYKTGGIVFGPNDDPEVDDYAKAMLRTGIPFNDYTAEEAMKRWPQLTLPHNWRVLFQADAGLVDARKANATHIALARARGAQILDNTRVHKVEPTSDGGVKITTSKGQVLARKIIVTSGTWTNKVLAGLGAEIPIKPTKEQVNYYVTPHLREFVPDRFPIWIAYKNTECYYGMPIYGEVATKAGQHVGGKQVDPDTRTFEPDTDARAKVENFLEQYIPRSLGPLLYTKTCLYANVPDTRFVIDRLPNHPQVAVAVGAGHAYKWACLIGLILTQLTLEEKTTYPIEAFSISRPQLGAKFSSKANL